MDNPLPPQKIRRDNRPLYTRAIEVLLEWIETGPLKPGDRMPSEEELADQLGISRSTLREAMGHLETYGLISRRQGVGTFVTESATSTFLGTLDRLEPLRARAKRLNLKVEVVERKISSVPPIEAWLDIFVDRGDRQLLRVESVETVDDTPIAYFDAYLRADLLDVAQMATFESSVIEALQVQTDHAFSHTRSSVFAIEAEPPVAKKLQVRPGKPILHLKEIYYSAEGEPLGILLNYFVTDQYHFYIIRKVVR